MSNPRRIAAPSPDVLDIAKAADLIKDVMGQLMVYVVALESDDCDDEVRKSVARMLHVHHNDLDTARALIERRDWGMLPRG